MKNPFIQASKKKKHLKIQVYGESGVGKTYFSLTFPNVAMIDTEGGTDFYSNRFSFHVLDTKSFADVLDAVNFLEKGGHGFETLVIDPVTLIWSALQEGRLEHKIQNPDKAVSGEEKTQFSYRDWNSLKRLYSLLMTKLINLPMHIILTSRLKDEYEINGGEMSKIGVKPEAEKSTAYISDIRFRLEVGQNGKRVAIFEKDRTGHFDRGSLIENPSYETFKALAQENDDDRIPQVIHPDDNEAAAKDACLFTEANRNRSENNASGATNRKTGNNGNGKKPISLGFLFNKLNSLGLQKLLPNYTKYCCRKYNVSNIKELTESQKQEQKAILESCRKPKRKAEFKGILQNLSREVPERDVTKDVPSEPINMKI